jgi:hypothetical protein
LAHDRFVVRQQPDSVCDYFLDAMEAYAAERAVPEGAEEANLDDSEEVVSGSESDSDVENESEEEEELLDV